MSAKEILRPAGLRMTNGGRSCPSNVILLSFFILFSFLILLSFVILRLVFIYRLIVILFSFVIPRLLVILSEAHYKGFSWEVCSVQKGCQWQVILAFGHRKRTAKDGPPRRENTIKASPERSCQAKLD